MRHTSESKYTRYGFVQIDKGIVRLFCRLPDFTHYELAVYTYVVSYVQDQARDNGRQGLSYPTKTRIADDLNIGRAKLNEVIDRLIAYRLFEPIAVPNYKGGHPLTMYRPLPLPDEDEFMRLYGDKITREDGPQKQPEEIERIISWL